MNKKYIIVTLACFIISLVSGLITNDLLIGGSILFTGLLCAYLATEAKRSNYIVSLINYLLMGYACYKNNLYGAALFCILVFSPLQIHGYITWKSNVDEEDTVSVREFTLKNSIIISLSCIVGSFILGYLLSLIPGQRLALLDSTSNIINLCGVILMILRFKECWWIWITNNIIDLSIWIINVINGGENAIMMLLVSIGYLLINIYGIISWNIKAKNEKSMKLIKLEHEITIEDIKAQYNYPNQKLAVIIQIKDKDGKILLQQRGLKSRGDNFLYEDIGGSVEEKDNTFKDAIIRELKEEVGENVNIEISDQIGIYTAYKNNINWIFIIYLGKYIDGELKIMEPEKCLGYKFFTKEVALNSDQVTDSCKYLIRELEDY